MNEPQFESLVGQTKIKDMQRPTTGSFVQLLGETYYRISHSDQIPSFFMSVVGGADHWLFITSDGGLTAGRVNPDSALFPYQTEDKLDAQRESTGSKTIIHALRNDLSQLWEPFSDRYAGIYDVERNLYKNIYGDKLVFEAINHDLGLTLRQAWRTSKRFGFVRTVWLQNDGDTPCRIDLLDGLQNVLPYGVLSATQRVSSNLLNAYKRNELEPNSGLGIFTLSATLTDQAEPSESLQTTVVWQVGLDVNTYLLSTRQIDAFRTGRVLTTEHDICGKAGAYLVTARFDLTSGEQKEWHIVADVNRDRVAITRLLRMMKRDQADIVDELEVDIQRNSAELIRLVAAADGLQQSAQESTIVHHYANVLFNIMRGGIFADGYHVERDALLEFVGIRNRVVLQEQIAWFKSLPATLDISDLYARAAETGDPNTMRLCYEFLPLIFSRRHGDPSRPWNHFSINLKKADGSPNLDYQGNWRDIFQNWEPLALAFPAYIEGIIAKFLNATTPDGYNPYRVTRDGIEWEIPEPDNPWSNIGYWSDHQIIYLQKLLEIAEKVQPGALAQLWNRPIFAYANVPYRLRSYQEMLKDWYNTIDFDWESEEATEEAVSHMGTDGRLLRDSNGNVVHVTMVEKLLVLLLAKLTNLVPDGGIWMNTQRPEWNDANNALVGKGLSVVTAAYLRRFIAFWQDQLAQRSNIERSFAINSTLAALFSSVQATFATYQPQLDNGFTPADRRAFMDALGMAITDYRATIYPHGIAAGQIELSAEDLHEFLTLAQSFIDHTLQANRRPDGMGHTYNILTLNGQGVSIEHLYLMLEGQVAYLSSGTLSSKDALTLLHSMRHSDLYRADQHSYMLYPNRKLPGFLQKNNVAAEQVADSGLVKALMAARDSRLLTCDDAGVFHFNGRFRNAKNVADVLDTLAQEPAYADWVAEERDFILDLFEKTFNHNSFTGRSGTFFAYEGLGSIYWHMVSKLLLAAQESYQQAVESGADATTVDALAVAYYDIRAGMGFNKTPDVYGAFPTDPYSHTPLGGGASQPGMTGLVKEEILTRWGELGVKLHNGALCFQPTMLRADEFLQANMRFNYVAMDGKTHTLMLTPRSLAFTCCQVPIIYELARDAASDSQIEIVFAYKNSVIIQGNCLDNTTTQHILNRTGHIKQVRVTVTI
ncbi:MAG: hypothetical protein M9965_16665 [Anaerolineae bacterium]|nr:hypothetical protein [Anaerolineae bacterium]